MKKIINLQDFLDIHQNEYLKIEDLPAANVCSNKKFFVTEEIVCYGQYNGEAVVESLVDLLDGNCNDVIFDCTRIILNKEILNILQEHNITKYIINKFELELYENLNRGNNTVYLYLTECPYEKCNTVNCNDKNRGYEFCNIDFDTNSWYFNEKEHINLQERNNILHNEFMWKEWLNRMLLEREKKLCTDCVKERK